MSCSIIYPELNIQKTQRIGFIKNLNAPSSRSSLCSPSIQMHKLSIQSIEMNAD